MKLGIRANERVQRRASLVHILTSNERCDELRHTRPRETETPVIPGRPASRKTGQIRSERYRQQTLNGSAGA